MKNKKIKGEQFWVCPETGDDVEALLCPECGMYPGRDFRCGIPFCCKFHASGIHDWNQYVKEVRFARNIDVFIELRDSLQLLVDACCREKKKEELDFMFTRQKRALTEANIVLKKVKK